MANETFNILKILVENPEEKYSIRKLSQLRKINYKSAYQAIMKLEQKGLAKLERLGNTTNCSFSQKFDETVFAVENERRQELLKDKNFKTIHKYFDEIQQQYILLIFGSHAKQTADKHSDIDLLAITENEKEIEQTTKKIPLNIHLTTTTNKDFTTMLKSKEFSVASEATKKNIILIGIEDYYRAINNARK